MTHLLLTVRWLDDRYHGLLAHEGPPEWPPSPYRLFQALVAGVARRGELDSALGESLAWLQRLDPPLLIAPRSRPGQVITRFVPNNDADKKPDRQSRLTGKTFRPTLMLDPPVIHYIWPIDKCDPDTIKSICEVARSLTTFGWGIDMAYADAQLISGDEIKGLFGVRWYPRPCVMQDSGLLRVPVVDPDTQENTLDDLRRSHQSALARIDHGKPLNNVEKPKVFDHVFYESRERPLTRPYIVFELRRDDGSFFTYPANKLVHIAGMVRHLAIEEMTKSPPDGVDNDWVEAYVAGHARPGAIEHRQLSYLPLASIGHTHTDPSVRRVMIAAPLGDDRFLGHLAIRLNGQQLIPTPETKLEHPPTLVRVRSDKVAPLYTLPASAWASVTPVILPGHNDHKPDKTRKLIEKALAQSGIEQPCEFEWTAFSHFRKSLSAHKYDREKRPTGYFRPDHLLTQTAVHLKLRFNDGVEVHGPLMIGAGRHCGFGLFARMDDRCLAQ
ncbi:MAG: type I-U CRISPR-associated protein Csb2 [Acidobacteria bacterium]|nr:type I-U CRISPR-associated protein Csb2 [Acidobacteriota bacterium]